jgi:hypothetical protein
MLTIKQWMELVEYRITEGSEYQWQCFGSDAYCLSSWNGDQDGYSFNIVFDTENQQVYTVEVCDYKNNRAYRVIDPNYRGSYQREAEQRDVDHSLAWDDCNFVDLDEDDDFIAKAEAIRSGVPYDTRVTVPLELTDQETLNLMTLAHEADMSLNQFVEKILLEAVRQKESEIETKKIKKKNKKDRRD